MRRVKRRVEGKRRGMYMRKKGSKEGWKEGGDELFLSDVLMRRASCYLLCNILAQHKHTPQVDMNRCTHHI